MNSNERSENGACGVQILVTKMLHSFFSKFFSKSESLDFLVISESESTVFPSSLSGSTQLALSRTTCFFFPSLMSLY